MVRVIEASMDHLLEGRLAMFCVTREGRTRINGWKLQKGDLTQYQSKFSSSVSLPAVTWCAFVYCGEQGLEFVGKSQNYLWKIP